MGSSMESSVSMCWWSGDFVFMTSVTEQHPIATATCTTVMLSKEALVHYIAIQVTPRWMSPETSWIACALFRIRHATISIDHNSPGASDQDIVLFAARLKDRWGGFRCLSSHYLSRTYFLCTVVAPVSCVYSSSLTRVKRVDRSEASTFRFYLSR